MDFFRKKKFKKIDKKFFQKIKSIHMGLNSFQKKTYPLMTSHYVCTPFFVKLQIFSDFDHFTAENTQKKAKNRKKT